MLTVLWQLWIKGNHIILIFESQIGFIFFDWSIK
jgi:hypothetical protein